MKNYKKIVLVLVAFVLLAGGVFLYLNGKTTTQKGVAMFSVEDLKGIYINYAVGGKLIDGQYLSEVIECNVSTCMSGFRLYFGLNDDAILFTDLDNDGVQDALVGIKYGYVDGNSDLNLAASSRSIEEFVAVVKFVDDKPIIIDEIYGPADADGSWINQWKNINSITAEKDGSIVVDAVEKVWNKKPADPDEIHRTYTTSAAFIMSVVSKHGSNDI